MARHLQQPRILASLLQSGVTFEQVRCAVWLNGISEFGRRLARRISPISKACLLCGEMNGMMGGFRFITCGADPLLKPGCNSRRFNGRTDVCEH
jgi:hypothetical protein